MAAETLWDIGSVAYHAWNGNWGDVAMDALAMCLPCVPAGTFQALRGLAGQVANSGSGKLYHYTSSKHADSIAENGLRPGGSGKVFTTADGSKSGLQAQIDLALPPNRGVPDALMEIDTKTLQNLGVKIPGSSQVKRDFNMPGGGQETVFDMMIPPEAIRRVR